MFDYQVIFGEVQKHRSGDHRQSKKPVQAGEKNKQTCPVDSAWYSGRSPVPSEMLGFQKSKLTRFAVPGRGSEPSRGLVRRLKKGSAAAKRQWEHREFLCVIREDQD